ncbi:MAG: hypothetical protein NVS2B8_19070 [Vulcanimicrobiaceae bacterium]
MEISYQPIVELKTGLVVKCEALCRPPEAGLDLGAFVASAEMNGSLHEYTDRVLDSVLANWRKHGPASIDLSLNLTVADLVERDILGRVEKACKRHRFDPRHLWFEVDDRLQAIVDPATLGNVAKLAKLGVRFSIDSFGDELTQATQYEVQSLQIAEVKINGRYVRDADENMEHRTAIATIVKMGQALRVDVCVKSVERENIASLMARMGATHAQGYYFARPMPAETVAALVTRMAQDGPLSSGR